MAPKGRKPKPYLLKESEGFRGHRSHAKGVDVPAGPFTSPLALEGDAKLEWDRILATTHWIRASEAGALADRCLCWQKLQAAEAEVGKTGFTVDTKEGVKLNPAVNAAKAYRQSLQRYDAELGLTSSSRTRVGSDAKREVDAIEAKLCG
jgi:P27 family predicted phage terminase small subunit